MCSLIKKLPPSKHLRAQILATARLPISNDNFFNLMRALFSMDVLMSSQSLECPSSVTVSTISLEDHSVSNSSMACKPSQYNCMETNNVFYTDFWNPTADATRDSTESIIDKICTRPY